VAMSNVSFETSMPTYTLSVSAIVVSFVCVCLPRPGLADASSQNLGLGQLFGIERQWRVDRAERRTLTVPRMIRSATPRVQADRFGLLHLADYSAWTYTPKHTRMTDLDA